MINILLIVLTSIFKSKQWCRFYSTFQPIQEKIQFKFHLILRTTNQTLLWVWFKANICCSFSISNIHFIINCLHQEPTILLSKVFNPAIFSAYKRKKGKKRFWSSGQKYIRRSCVIPINIALIFLDHGLRRLWWIIQNTNNKYCLNTIIVNSDHHCKSHKDNCTANFRFYTTSCLK